MTTENVCFTSGNSLSATPLKCVADSFHLLQIQFGLPHSHIVAETSSSKKVLTNSRIDNQAGEFVSHLLITLEIRSQADSPSSCSFA